MKKQFWSLLTIGFIALNFIACGKKNENNGIPADCGTNAYYDSYTGSCVSWNNPNGTPYSPYINNGRITHESGFRDLVQRTFGRYYRCLYNYNPGAFGGYGFFGYGSGGYSHGGSAIDYSCKSLQVKVQKISDNTYRVNIRSAAMLGSQGNHINGHSYVGTEARSESLGNGFAIEIRNGNPYPFVETRLILDRPLDQDIVNYTLEFNRREIARGQLIKGRDF